jgi:hypothetical protein
VPGFIENLSIYFEQIIYENKSRQIPITKPIFIVGCHRSGTTILYETPAQHPDLAFFTNASSYSPKSPICANWVAKVMLGGAKIEQFFEDGMQVSCNSPVEGTRLWECYSINPQDITKLVAIVGSKMHQYGYALDYPKADCELFSSVTIESSIYELPKSIATYS